MLRRINTNWHVHVQGSNFECESIFPYTKKNDAPKIYVISDYIIQILKVIQISAGRVLF